jgi:hypothetical protein
MSIKMKKNLCVLIVLALLVSACEKMVVNDEDGTNDANVMLRIVSYEQASFPAKTKGSIEDVCSRLCFHIYNDVGERVAYVNQKVDGDGFGNAYFTLERGHYYLIVVGHSASNNPSFSKNERVSISGSDLGDTFWCARDLEIGDEAVVEDLTLNRIVSRINIIPVDKAPAEMNQMIFSYKGSKGTFDGLTGYGSTNTNQTVVQDVNSADKQFGFYMIPSAEKDSIDLAIRTYSVNEKGSATPLTEKKISRLPVQRNSVTVCKGNLFDNESSEMLVEIIVRIDDEWGPDIDFPF